MIGCAKGDLHDIGKSLVATQLSVNGFEVTDIGVDVSNNKSSSGPRPSARTSSPSPRCSPTSQYYMEELIKRLEDDGLRDKYRVVVGGGPISGEYAQKIGADGYSRTARGAVHMCQKLMALRPKQELASSTSNADLR